MRDPLRQTMSRFHNACGSLEGDGFAPYELPSGEWLEWRMRPLSATQLAGLDIKMRGLRRTVRLRPGRVPAVFPFARCFGPSILDAVALRAALRILRDPRIQRQAIEHYSPLFALSMQEAAIAIARRLRPGGGFRHPETRTCLKAQAPANRGFPPGIIDEQAHARLVMPPEQHSGYPPIPKLVENQTDPLPRFHT